MRLLLRHDTPTKWESVNPVLMDAEIVVVEEDGFRSLAIGDGEHRFTELPRVKLQKGLSVMMGRYQSGRARLHIVKDETVNKEEEKAVIGENYLVLDGKRMELTEEQKRLLNITMRKNPFAPVEKGETYYYINKEGLIDNYPNREDSVDISLEKSCNHFNDEAFAEQVTLHQLLYRKMLKFAWDNGYEDTPEWNGENSHWRVYYDSDTKRFVVSSNESYKQQSVYFSSKEGAECAIEKVIKPFIADYPEFEW